MEDSPSSASKTRVPARYALFGAVAGVLALGMSPTRSHGAERPRDDREVLAHVPARSDRSVQELEQQRLAARQAPHDLDQALALARSEIEASRRAGDPRYLGAAEATLAPWTTAANPPPSVLVLRATILQSRHEFELALRDLDRVLELTPLDAQAWLTRATVLTVQGDYAKARESCAALDPLVSSIYAIACRAPIDALTGHGADARSALVGALTSRRAPTELAWLHSLAAESDFWLGDPIGSEQHVRAALALDQADRYSRALYADLLLDAGRHDEVRSLLRDHGDDDALALRDALAALAMGQRDARVIDEVSANFEASRLRGDSVHRREEARLWLARGDAARALTCARESWAVQHEAWDARLVLESALASKQPAQASAVLAWLDSTHFESPKLRALQQKLGSLR